jgi:natural product biosynthesis luciferase-like monooxygenase protein
MTQTPFSCVLIGSDSLLIECGEIWLTRGNRIQAVVTDTSRISNWAAQRGITVIAADSDYAAELAKHAFDYLFAITFLRVIPKAVLALPKRAAINFHDGPLPHYAGLNAPTWALVNQEREYGITWHVMTDRLDGGEVLKQVSFEVNDDETSLSLNTRCFAAAIETFGQLSDELAQGTETRTAQVPPTDASKAYFGRYARPPAATVLDFTEPADKLAALLRALDFGPRYPNTLGAATIIAGDRAFAVTSAEASLEDSASPAGTIVAAGGDSISVACGQGTLLIRGLRDLTGAPIAMHDALAQLRLEVGGKLVQLSAAERTALTELDKKIAKSERFWVERLATLDPTDPPYASGVPLTTLGAFAELAVNVPEPFRAQYGGANADSALAAAFACYIGRLAGTAQVALALSDQTLAGVTPAFAPLLAASAPVLIETEPAPRFADVIARLDAARADAHNRGGFLRNIAVRYPELTDSAAARDPGLLPVGIALGVDAIAGSVLQLQVKGGSARLRYESSRLNAQAAARIAAELSGYLQNLASAGDRPVEQMEVLSEQAKRQIVVDWNNTSKALAAVRCVHQEIEAQIDRTPDAVALVCEDRVLTFKELDLAANSVAKRLIALGVTFDKPVGVYTERSLDLVVGALGVLKAGGAYVPLDPAYPADRIAYMIEDAHLDVVVTQSALAQQVPGRNVRTVLVDAPETFSSAEPRPNVAVQPAHLAYLIYTSGSTGKPKGVMVEHRQAHNFFVGMDERVANDPSQGRTWLAVTSLSFDISVLELWWTLSRGFKVVVHADRARAGAAKSKAAAGGGRPLQFSLFYFSADAHATGGARYRLLLEGAKFADTHGFSAVWTPERHFHAFGGLYPNPAVTGAAVAAITQNVQVRAGSVVLPLHHPARVAEQWAVVDNISNGRVGVSFASGWQPDDFVFAPENYKDAKGVMMRNIEVVRKLWRGETVTFDGPQGPVPVRTLPDPVQKELPVWLTTAGNAESFEMAGKAGANLLTHLLGQTLEKLAPKIAAYRKARAAAGFDPNTGIVSLMLHTFVGEDRDEVKETVRAPLKAYLATSMDLIKDKASVFPAFAKPKGTSNADLDAGFSTLTPEDKDALLEGAFERYFEQSGLFGTVEDALSMVEKVRAIGVDDVACLIDFGAPTDLVFDHLPFLDQVRAAAVSLNASQPEAAAAPAFDSGEHPFLRDVRSHKVTHMQCTPSMARMLLDNADTSAGIGALEHLLLGGEALAPDLLQDLRKISKATITNMYGPTETTVWSSTHRVSPEDKTVPIGKAIVNTTFYVTDKRGRLLPAGVDGELWIGGKGVTRGYFERAELTSQRFVKDPFSNEPDARMYNTGDRARFRPDGVLEFLGRADFQVKLRGYRIELGEIESRARTAPGVKDAVVIVREDRPGDQRLVGYLVPADLSKVNTFDTEPVRELLRAQLPDYMVPVAFVVLAELPLTPNRKTDRKALPAPQLQAAAGASEQKEAPESETDQAIAKVWRDVLGRDDVGLDDNFFDLGGHSLLVVRAHRQLQDALGRALALTDLYRFPTIRKFSTFLTEGASGDTKKAGARGAKRREAMRRRVG